jgi:arabinofuranosyltransferase
LDERAFYRERTSITSLAENPWVLKLAPRWPRPGEVRVRSVRLGGAIGFAGFEWGPEVHVVDILGLADPLLARLPTQDRHAWRIGHFERKLPLGYLETLRSGNNRIADPQLAEYYERLDRILRGELWDRQRWRDIASLNLGDADRLIDVAEYSRPYSWVLAASEAAKSSTATLGLVGPVSFVLPARNGLLLQFDDTLHCSTVDLGLAAGAHYRVTYYSNGEPIVTADRKAHYLVPFQAAEDIRDHRLVVPDAVMARGYDALLVFPIVANESSHHAFVWVDACVPG